MTVEVYCDYCGELIEGEFVTIKVGGLGDPCPVERQLFQYHAEATNDHYYACYQRAASALSNAAKWAHSGEGSGMEWHLRPALGAALAADPKMMSTTPVEGSLPLDEANLHPGSALSLRRGGVRTFEEAAARSEIELLALEGVAKQTISQLAEALADRELSFRPGPTPEQLGSRLRELREAAGLSRSDLACAIRTDGDDSIYGTDLAAWEKGRRVPTAKRLERLAALFQHPLEHFTDHVEGARL